MAKDPESGPIGLDEVKNIARLAHLELAPEELERMTRELAAILAYVKQLEELDVGDVGATVGGLAGASMSPLAHSPGARSVPGTPGATATPDDVRLPLRADEPSECLPRELALREAPKAAHDGFAVPAFVDEG